MLPFAESINYFNFPDPDIFLEGPINDLKLVLWINNAIQLRIGINIISKQKLVGGFSKVYDGCSSR